MITSAEVIALNSQISPAVADFWIEALMDRVEDYLGRPIEETDYVDELYMGSGTRLQQLRAFPVVSVEKVEIDGCEIDLSEVSIYGRHRDFLLRECDKWPRTFAGVNHLTEEPFGEGFFNIKISYRAGYATCPASLKAELLEQIAYRACRSINEPGTLVELRTPGGMTRKWRPDDEAGSRINRLPLSITSILDGSRFRSEVV